MNERELGADQERRRILKIILTESALHRIEGNDRIAGVLAAVALAIRLDHREDNER